MMEAVVVDFGQQEARGEHRSPAEPDIQALLSAARQGDRQAFAGLVKACYAGVVRVVYRMYGDELLAEDAAQDAFTRAWQNLGDFNPGQSFRPGQSLRPGQSFHPWLYRIALNAAVDRLRSENRHVRRAALELDALEGDRLPPELVSAGQPEDPQRAVESREAAGQVRRAVLDLPESMRAALVLREYGGMTYAEIAAALGVPQGTVMSRLNAARARLRAALQDFMEVK